MTKHPDERITTIYEWVVEEIEVVGDDRDIIECFYFDENQRDQAEATASTILKDGGSVDFGLCRRSGSDADGETDRTYAYRAPDGSWPETFDNGRDVPKRFGL